MRSLFAGRKHVVKETGVLWCGGQVAPGETTTVFRAQGDCIACLRAIEIATRPKPQPKKDPTP